MTVNKTIARFSMGSLLALIVVSSLASTGCAVNTNGMTLPSPYYTTDYAEYYPAGPEFPFTREAANMQESQPDRTP